MVFPMVIDCEEYPVTESPVVYFLFDGDELVYIGQTRQFLGARLQEHRGRVFNRVYFVRVKSGFLDEVEMFYIKLYQPKYNVVGMGGKKAKPLTPIESARRRIEYAKNEKDKKKWLAVLKHLEWQEENPGAMKYSRNVYQLKKQKAVSG